MTPYKHSPSDIELFQPFETDLSSKRKVTEHVKEIKTPHFTCVIEMLHRFKSKPPPEPKYLYTPSTWSDV